MATYHVFTQHACVFAHYKTIESQSLSAVLIHRAKSHWGKPNIFTSSVRSPLAAKLHLRYYFHYQPYVNVVNVSEADINPESVYSGKHI